MINFNSVDNIASYGKDGPPNERIKDAQSARSILDVHLRDDQPSSERRAEIQSVIDGNPPNSQKELDDVGRGDAINVNWGHAESKIEMARLPYFNMLTDVAQFTRITNGYGKNEAQQNKWGRIQSEGFHNLLKGSTNHILTHLLVQANLVTHGYGCAHFRDGLDFKSYSIRPENLVVPRDASTQWNDWEYCFILDNYKADELYRYIQNPKAAERGGWNIKSVESSLKNAMQESQDKDHPWEYYQREIKNNGLWTSVTKSKVIRVAHLYIKEFKGGISHYVFDRDGNGEWLCKKRNRYAAFNQCFTIFFSDVGNGDFHSIRGLGQKLYKFSQAINRVNNALLEGVIIDSAKMIQASTAGDIKRMQSIQIGPYRILPAGFKPFAVPPSNLAEALQVTQFFSSQESDQNSSYLPTMGSLPRKMSKQELDSKMQDKAKLTNTRAEFYMLSLDSHYREVYRRASNPNLLEEDSGGLEALQFQKYCKSRGVPKAAMRSSIEVEATRSIGQGSPAARAQAMNAIAQFMGQVPEAQRVEIVRDSIAAIGGQRFADIYGPKDDDQELKGSDASVASLENNAFLMGGQVVISPNQNHYVHATIHLKFFAEIVNAVKKQAIDPRKADQTLNAGGPHLMLHLKYLQSDSTRKEQFEELNQQTSELLKIADQISQMAQEQDKQAQEQQQQGQQTDPKEMVIQNRMRLDTAKAQNDMQIKIAKAKQMMQLKDTTTAQRLHLTNVNFEQDQRQKFASMEED